MAWISVWCSKLCYFDFHALLSSSIHIVWQWRMDIPYFWAFVLSSMSGCQKWMRKFLDCHEKWGTSALRSVHNFSNKSTCLYCVTLNFTTELLWRPTHPRTLRQNCYICSSLICTLESGLKRKIKTVCHLSNSYYQSFLMWGLALVQWGWTRKYLEDL